MPYFLIIMILIGLAISLYFLMGDDSTINTKLSKSRVSDTIHTIISDGGNYALVMYHHDQYDEAQLSWALSNAKGLHNIDIHNIFFYNIGNKILSKRIINSTFVKVNENDFTVLNGYPDSKSVSYMFIIKYKGKRIIFNTSIDI